MASTPLADMRFPEHITGIKKKDGNMFKCGYDYQTQHPGWTQCFVHSEVVEIVLSDHFITPTSPNVLQTPWFDVFEFANGYKVKCFFRAFPSGNNYTYFVEFHIYSDQDVEIQPGEIPSCMPGGSINFSTVQSVLLQDVTVYMIGTTHYPQGNPGVNDAPADFRFTVIAGSRDSGFFIDPSSVTYLNDITGYVGYNYAFYISNMQDFAYYMKNHGDSFDGDIDTDEEIPEDPAGSDDNSTTGGGGGNYDDTSDPIDFPDLPTGGALECGAVVGHRVAAQTLLAIISKLWDTSLWDVSQSWQKSIDDPMNAIVSLHCLPVSPEVGEQTEIWIGNFDTNLTSPPIVSQYVEVDCGSINVKEFWGSALDYSPYTRVEIYLPFVGIKDLSAEDVMRSAVHVKYHVDVLSGDVIAFVKCGLSVLYHFRGNCCMPVPLTSRSKDTLINALTGTGQVVSGVGSGMAVGGVAGGLGIAGTALSVAASVVASKVRTSKGSELGGAGSLMDDFVPYLIFHRPVQSLAKDYNKFKGYPSNITATLGNLSGYTEVEHIHLQGIPNATSEEMAEIVNLLKNGVII